MKITIDGTTYETPASLTFRERRLIKQVTGLSGIEWLAAVQTLDDDVALGYAAVVLWRNGTFPGIDVLLDRDISSITLDLSEEIEALRKELDEQSPPVEAGGEAEAAPPASPAKSKRSARSKTPPTSGARS